MLALTFAPVSALTALADGAPSPAATASPSFRPPSGVLRHVDAPLASPALPTVEPLASPAHSTIAGPPAKRELVVLVGGYQSCSCDDPTFDDLIERITAAGYDVRRFGQDARYPYDTYGHVDENARNLRDQIRSVSTDYSAIHIVTHSMGGVVADRAFAQGLSADDGVVTYVSLSGPHGGSDAAKAATLVDAFGPSELIRRLGSLAGFESRSDAIPDLARARPVPPPAGVVRLDLRAATDVLVTERDARDPGVPSRILAGGLDGHGGILTDPAAIDVTLRTITTRRVPPEERPQESIERADRTADLIGALVAIGLAVGTIFFLLHRLGAIRTLEDILAQRLPAARRRRCA